ncbi:MAG TPA: hypothetical protein VF553_06555 [Pyrinomonadaceae bacterium]
MSLSLKEGEQQFVTAVSSAPYDSLRELIEALTSLLLDGNRSFKVKWNCEPDELDFEITAEPENDGVSFRVLHYTDHRRLPETGRTLFSIRTQRLELGEGFWRALRDLRRHIATDDFDRNWRRPFPQTEMQRLTEAIRSFKRQAKAIKDGDE